jgi:CubicO group peptidase (beta-lactamase class C family)
MQSLRTILNPDLTVLEGNKARWTHADYRRVGMHNLHQIARYTMGFRAAEVWNLTTRANLDIAAVTAVRRITALPCFSAMVVLKDDRVLFEKYAADFGPHCPHSIQSITKTMMNLVMGGLVDRGLVDLEAHVSAYLPEIGSGYANATIQQVLNMDVVNDYTEDFSDSSSTYFVHEEAMGWRLPRQIGAEATQRSIVASITSSDVRNHTGYMQYKDANTDVLGWIAERVSGAPLRSFLADIADASGFEDALHMTTDREGFPTLDGGACMSARDLARYFSIFVRRGAGVNGRQVGSRRFIEQTLDLGVPIAPPRDHRKYSNHTAIYGRAIGHSGWAGQCALANLDTRLVAVLLSVTEDEHGVDRPYLNDVSEMLQHVVELEL